MGSRSESKSKQTNQTINTDKRIANESGMVAQDGSSISANYNIQTVDKDIVHDALDAVRVADATSGQGVSKLLDLAGQLTSKTQDTASNMAGRYTQDVMQGISQLKSDQNGSIDQRTMVILGATAAAAVVGMAVAKRKAN